MRLSSVRYPDEGRRRRQEPGGWGEQASPPWKFLKLNASSVMLTLDLLCDYRGIDLDVYDRYRYRLSRD